MFALALVSLALPLAALAAPAELVTRATVGFSANTVMLARLTNCIHHLSQTYCGQYDQANFGTYTLFLDQWGIGTGITGSDCATVTSQSSNTIAWTNKWSWTGGTGIKSYTNVQQNSGANRQLSAIGTMNVRPDPMSALLTAIPDAEAVYLEVVL